MPTDVLAETPGERPGEAAGKGSAPATGPGRRGRGHGHGHDHKYRRGRAAAGWAAVAAWALATPVAVALPALVDHDPLTPRGAVLPIAVGGVPLAVLITLALLRRLRPYADVLAGISAGLFAAWVALTLRTALYGTPFGFAGLYGDEGRMSAMATRYTVGLASTDGIVSGVPSEYPPLFPWLVGRAAALVHVPAWRLLGPAQTLTISAAVLIAFLLWRRLGVAGPVALALAAVPLLVFGDPRKAHEVLALMVFVPWVPAALGFPPRGRLHWLPAGIIGGLIMASYLGFLIWGALGLLAYAAVTIRTVADRRGYLVRLGLAAIVAVVTAAWYLVPYGWALARHGGQLVSDLFPAPGITEDPFPFLRPTALGVLQLIGLAGIVWYRRAIWWATPLLCLLAGAYLYRAIAMLRYVATGHTGLFYHTSRMIGVLLAVAGVLTLAHALPRVVAGLATRPDVPRGAGVAALAVLLAWIGVTYWADWTPRQANRYAMLAHAEPRPDGTLPRFAPASRNGGPVTSWFPVDPIRAAVARALGRRAAPRTLSYDERLFAYLPWPGYIAVDRTAAASTSHWDDRQAALRRLAAVADPAAFARAGTQMFGGRIDVFVLRRSGSSWLWRDIRFRPDQFGRTAFTVVSDLPNNTVVAIRRG